MDQIVTDATIYTYTSDLGLRAPECEGTVSKRLTSFSRINYVYGII